MARGNPSIKKIQALAKEIKAKNPGMKHTEAISQASKQIKADNKK